MYLSNFSSNFRIFVFQGIEEALKVEDDCWSPEGFLDVKPHVVLHDKLISDAVLGGNLPIKTEHSYCTRIFNSDDDNSRDSNSTSFQKMQDGKYDNYMYFTSYIFSESLKFRRFYYSS